MPVPVLAESERWLVVAKPAKLAVHRSAMVRDRRTLIKVVRSQTGLAVSPVHRLDRATSGCLLLSKDSAWTAMAQKALAEGHKTYLAFCRGNARAGVESVVDKPVKTDKGLKDALTHIRCLGGAKDPRCSVFLAHPKTGRNHQVRRHLRDAGHPIIGDSKHGDTRINRWWRENHNFDRLGLHCWSLRLTVGDEEIDVRCGLPTDLVRTLRRLPYWSEMAAELPALEDPWSTV